MQSCRQKLNERCQYLEMCSINKSFLLIKNILYCEETEQKCSVYVCLRKPSISVMEKMTEGSSVQIK